MKKKIATAMLTLATACGFAQDATPQPTLSTEKLPTALEVTLVPAEEKLPKKSFFYIRAEAAPVTSVGVIPGMGIGYRLISGASAIDFSASGKGRSKGDHSGYVWTFPKMNYLYYLTPSAEGSLYVGGGVALGGISTKTPVDREESSSVVEDSDLSFVKTERNEFNGMIANATVGYEMQRNEKFRSFVQLDLNQPVVASYQKGPFPGPSAEFSLGAGF